MPSATPQLPLAKRSASKPLLDLYAMSLSGLCLVHCLALPLMASLLPLLGQLSEWEWVHRALVLLAAPVTLWVIWLSRIDQHLRWFRRLAMAALLLLLAAAFSERLAAWEEPLTILGATLLGGSHLLRWRRMAGACAATLPSQQ